MASWQKLIPLLAGALAWLLPMAALPDNKPNLSSKSAALTSAQPQYDEELLRLLKSSVTDASSFADKYDAEVWLLDKSGPLKRFIDDKTHRLDLLKKIHREAMRADLQPEIVLAVIEIESGFNRYAISRVGAQGIMQVMPFWKNEIGRPDDNLILTDTNLRYGCTILKYYLDKEKGNMANALARYNGSYGSYHYSQKVLDAWVNYWR